MIKFFRKIRQKLIGEGNLKRYLIYAIGEILLVVIGILIALQINNWNELDKEKATGIEYLLRIHSDLEKDTAYLNKKVSFAKEEQQSYYSYIQSMYDDQSSTEEFIKLTSSVYWNAENLILENTTYNEITNSGKFSFIDNETLRGQIMDYYRRFAAIDENISEMNQTSIEMFADSYKIIIKYYDIFDHFFKKESMLNKTDWEFINNPRSQEFKELESSAFRYYYKQTVFEKNYEELIIKASNLIEKIEYETNLNKK